jgi:hypothetical protein
MRWILAEAHGAKAACPFADRFLLCDNAARLEDPMRHKLLPTTLVILAFTAGLAFREMGNFRWTVVFEKQHGTWLIIHEHISVPAQ